jgi:hypothetical protein
MANQVLYGFLNLQDVYARRVTEVGVQVVTDAIEATVQEHNRQINALIGLFARRTTDFKIRYRTAALARLQPLDENGRARPIKALGQYDVAFPVHMAGTAWGGNYVSLQKLTVAEAAEFTATMTSADMRWVRDHILAALFANANWTFTDPLHGALTVKGLANGDTDVYQVMGGADQGAADTHYLAQAGAIADAANPFPTIREELLQHPENGGEVVALVPTANIAAVKALANFVPVTDPNIEPGSTTRVLTGDLGTAVPGEAVGYVDGVWIVEWRSLPDNYLIATTTEGPRPLAMREEPEETLQGFRFVATRPDYPYEERQFLRIAGFGAWNRVGALVQRVGNGTYAVPTNYGSPMP